MNTPKTVWSRPELIVLVRGRPEEAVLTGCKLDLASTGPIKNKCRAAKGSDPCLEHLTS